MADPVPAGSDVSAGTYQCTKCTYELGFNPPNTSRLVRNAATATGFGSELMPWRERSWSRPRHRPWYISDAVESPRKSRARLAGGVDGLLTDEVLGATGKRHLR